MAAAGFDVSEVRKGRKPGTSVFTVRDAAGRRADPDAQRHRPDGSRLMDAFTRLDAKAAPLPLANIDTDQIIPKQFLKTVEREGLAKGLFYDLRFDGEGQREARTSCSTSRPTRAPACWSPATTSAAARAASTRPGRCWTSASAA